MKDNRREARRNKTEKALQRREKLIHHKLGDWLEDVEDPHLKSVRKGKLRKGHVKAISNKEKHGVKPISKSKSTKHKKITFTDDFE